MHPVPLGPDTRSPALVAAAFAATYAGLTPLHLLLLDDPARAVMAVLALCSSLGLGVVAVRTRRRAGAPRWWTDAVVAVAVLNTVAHLGTTRDAGQTTVVMMAALGVGGLVGSRRSAAALVGALCAGWAAVALTGFAAGSAPVGHLTAQVGLSVVGAALLHESRRRSEVRLRAASTVLAGALERSETDRAAADEAGERLRLLFSCSPVGIGMTDEQGRFVVVNDMLCELYGQSESALLGRTSMIVTHPDDVSEQGSSRRLLAASTGAVQLEKRYVRPDGSTRWAWLTLSATPGPQGQAWTLVHVQDVTDRHEAERRLADSEADLAAVSRVVRQIRTGQDSRSTIVAAVLALTGASGALLVEHSGGAVVTASHGAVPVGLDSALTTLQVLTSGAAVLQDGVLWQPVVTASGTVAVLVAVWDDPGRATERAVRAVEMLADETAVALEHDSLLERLGQQAVTDSLTGLPNRRGWDAALAASRDQDAGPGRLHVALIDLDHFKRFNDAYGHEAGDGLLQELSGTCRLALRDADVLARWGGEEFAVLLPDCSAADARTVLERLRAAVPQGQTASVGMATWDGVEQPRQLLARADRAMYEAKRLGRDRVVADVPMPAQRRAGDRARPHLVLLGPDVEACGR